MNDVIVASPVEIAGTGWLQRHPRQARELLCGGTVIRWTNLLSGLHRGLIMPGRPGGCGELIPVPWSELLTHPARIADRVRDGAVFELHDRGDDVLGYVCYWDDAAIGDGRPQSYATREGAGNGWRPVTRTFGHPADAVAVRA